MAIPTTQPYWIIDITFSLKLQGWRIVYSSGDAMWLNTLMQPWPACRIIQKSSFGPTLPVGLSHITCPEFDRARCLPGFAWGAWERHSASDDCDVLHAEHACWMDGWAIVTMVACRVPGSEFGKRFEWSPHRMSLSRNRGWGKDTRNQSAHKHGMMNDFSCWSQDGVPKGVKRKVCKKHRYRKMARGIVHSKSFLPNIYKTWSVFDQNRD